MKIRLADWDVHGVVRMLDTELGLAVVDPSSRVVHGFVAVVNADAGKSGWAITAVYAQSGQLLLQIDDRRWNLDLVTLVHEIVAGGSLCSFAVVVAGRREFETVYASFRLDPLNQVDPSFDDLDEEMQDMFLWLARMADKEDWRRSVSARWSEGFETGR